MRGKVTEATCNRNNFKKDKKKIWKGTPNDDLQCFCEPHNKPDPFHCAGEGEVCQCPKGNVFFGAKFEPGTAKLNTFKGMMEQEYTALSKPKGGEVLCAAESFVGGHRLPGFVKDCYCDDKGTVDESVVTDEITYWEGVAEEEAAMEAEAAAEAQAEAARVAAAQETAAMKAEVEAAKIKIKAAEERYKKAQEDAKRKAEEQAAKDAADAAAAAAAEAAKEKELAAQAA